MAKRREIGPLAQQELLLPEPFVAAGDALTIRTMTEGVLANGALAEHAETYIRMIDPAGIKCAYAEPNCVAADQSLPPTAEPMEDQPTTEWQVQAAEGKVRLHQDKSFGPVYEPVVTDLEDPREQLLLEAPTLTEDELSLYRKMKPPRVYSKTRLNICIMVTGRQRQIDARDHVLDMDTFSEGLRPSRNMMLKIPKLFTHWFDKQYRWNIITWLRHYSGRKEVDVSEIVSTLYISLSPEAWVMVTAVGKEVETIRLLRCERLIGRCPDQPVGRFFVPCDPYQPLSTIRFYQLPGSTLSYSCQLCQFETAETH